MKRCLKTGLFLLIACLIISVTSCKKKKKPTTKYELTIRCEEGGTVSGTQSGEYAEKESISLVATSNTGYFFDGWYCETSKVSDDAEYTFSMPNQDLTVVAHFREIEVTHEASLEVVCVGTGSTNATIEGYEVNELHTVGTEVELTAIAPKGYHFVGWYQNEVLLTNEIKYVFTIQDNTHLVAKFAEDKVINKYSVFIATEGEGTVTGQKKEYLENETLTLTASASLGYEFAGWYLENNLVETDLTYSMVVTKDCSITAKFTKIESKKYTLQCSVSDTEGGIIKYQAKESYLENETVTLDFKVATGYQFVGWYIMDKKVSSDFNYVVTMTENITLVAKVEKIPTYSLVVTVLPEETYGVVTGVKSPYYEGDKAILTATPNAGFEFVGWYQGETLLEQKDTYQFQIGTEDVTISARFKKSAQKYLLDVSTNGLGFGVVDPLDKNYYEEGEKVTLNTINNDPTTVVFKGWYLGDTLLSTQLTYEYTMPAKNVLIFSVYEFLHSNTLCYDADGEGTIQCSKKDKDGQTISLSQESSNEKGETITFVATPTDGYEFAGWYMNDAFLSKETTYSYTMEDIDVIMIAKFVESGTTVDNYQVSWYVNINQEKTLIKKAYYESGTYIYSRSVYVDVPLDKVWDEKWYENGEFVNGFVLSKDCELNCYFEDKFKETDTTLRIYNHDTKQLLYMDYATEGDLINLDQIKKMSSNFLNNEYSDFSVYAIYLESGEKVTSDIKIPSSGLTIEVGITSKCVINWSYVVNDVKYDLGFDLVNDNVDFYAREFPKVSGYKFDYWVGSYTLLPKQIFTVNHSFSFVATAQSVVEEGEVALRILDHTSKEEIAFIGWKQNESLSLADFINNRRELLTEEFDEFAISMIYLDGKTCMNPIKITKDTTIEVDLTQNYVVLWVINDTKDGSIEVLHVDEYRGNQELNQIYELPTNFRYSYSNWMTQNGSSIKTSMKITNSIVITTRKSNKVSSDEYAVTFLDYDTKEAFDMIGIYKQHNQFSIIDCIDLISKTSKENIYELYYEKEGKLIRLENTMLIESDMEFYAKRTTDYLVGWSIHDEEGKIISVHSFSHYPAGTSISILSLPEEEGFMFVGWIQNSESITGTTYEINENTSFMCVKAPVTESKITFINYDTSEICVTLPVGLFDEKITYSSCLSILEVFYKIPDGIAIKNIYLEKDGKKEAVDKTQDVEIISKVSATLYVEFAPGHKVTIYYGEYPSTKRMLDGEVVSISDYGVSLYYDEKCTKRVTDDVVINQDYVFYYLYTMFFTIEFHDSSDGYDRTICQQTLSSSHYFFNEYTPYYKQSDKIKRINENQYMEFVGWMDEKGKLVDSKTIVESSGKLYAKWEEVEVIHLTLTYPSIYGQQQCDMVVKKNGPITHELLFNYVDNQYFALGEGYVVQDFTYEENGQTVSFVDGKSFDVDTTINCVVGEGLSVVIHYEDKKEHYIYCFREGAKVYFSQLTTDYHYSYYYDKECTQKMNIYQYIIVNEDMEFYAKCDYPVIYILIYKNDGTDALYSNDQYYFSDTDEVVVSASSIINSDLVLYYDPENTRKVNPEDKIYQSISLFLTRTYEYDISIYNITDYQYSSPTINDYELYRTETIREKYLTSSNLEFNYTIGSINQLYTSDSTFGYFRLEGFSLTPGGELISIPYELKGDTELYCVWKEVEAVSAYFYHDDMYYFYQMFDKNVKVSKEELLEIFNQNNSVLGTLATNVYIYENEEKVEITSPIYVTEGMHFKVDFSDCYVVTFKKNNKAYQQINILPNTTIKPLDYIVYSGTLYLDEDCTIVCPENLEITENITIYLS